MRHGCASFPSCRDLSDCHSCGIGGVAERWRARRRWFRRVVVRSLAAACRTGHSRAAAGGAMASGAGVTIAHKAAPGRTLLRRIAGLPSGEPRRSRRHVRLRHARGARAGPQPDPTQSLSGTQAVLIAKSGRTDERHLRRRHPELVGTASRIAAPGRRRRASQRSRSRLAEHHREVESVGREQLHAVEAYLLQGRWSTC